MDTSNATVTGSPARPNVQLWDMLHQKGKDEWTKEAADQVTEVSVHPHREQDGFRYFCPDVLLTVALYSNFCSLNSNQKCS